MDTQSTHSGRRVVVRCSRQLMSGLLTMVVVSGFGMQLAGCEDIRRRRVEVNQASGADSSIDSRFGLTADAQDPSERDKELGYGRWKQKPETEGTAAPTSRDRRKPW